MLEVKTPVSEILDRLSIMRLKKEKRNTKDFDELIQNYEDVTAKVFNTGVATAFEHLITINSQLWELEDTVRSKISVQQFYDVAKQIFHLNEVRASVKGNIEKMTKGIVDAKVYSKPT